MASKKMSGPTDHVYVSCPDAATAGAPCDSKERVERWGASKAPQVCEEFWRSGGKRREKVGGKRVCGLQEGEGRKRGQEDARGGGTGVGEKGAGAG